MLVRTIFDGLCENDPAISILLYVIEHTDPETKLFSRSYSQIEKDLHVSSSTVARTFKKLSDSGVLVNTGLGKWFNRIIGKLDDPDDGPDFLAEFKGR